MKSKTNLRKSVVTIIVAYWLLLICIAFFNIYFNVYGLFSDYQFNNKVVTNDRIAKFNWINVMNEKPDCYILGSSNSMRFNPDSLQSITGLKSFNFGLFHARAEDYWCISNVLIYELKAKPKLIFFCLDDWNFADEPAPSDEIFKGAEKRLAYKKKYAKYLNDYSSFKLFWGQLKMSLTFNHLKNSMICLYETIKSEDGFVKTIPSLTDAFFENGTRRKYGRIDRNEDITDTCETGKYDVTAYLKEVDEFWKKFPNTKNGILDKSHEKFKKYSQRRLDYFEKTIALLEENNCKVVINIMPNQPYFKAIMLRETNYKDRLIELKKFLAQLQEEHPNILYIKDNSGIEKFDGFENHFFDDLHPTSVNSDLMIESFRDNLSEHAF